MNHESSLSNVERSLAFPFSGLDHLSSPCAVARLCSALDAAFDAVISDAADPSHHASFARSVRAALAVAVADPSLLTDEQHEGAAQSYRRHLLAADPCGRYAVAALVWMPGQASPIHAHQTWCGYAVIEGELTETVYEWNDSLDSATEKRDQMRATGAVSFTRAGRTGIHRLGNRSARAAISLHVYGVEGAQIATHVNDLVRVAECAQNALA